VLIFQNRHCAGATLEHSHSQLIALPIVPKRVREEVDGSLTYYRYKERCIFCDIVRQEPTPASGSSAKLSSSRSPFAPRFPFET
jgi:UDPglucose--hexose-1-phosphate uridylyltransferase